MLTLARDEQLRCHSHVDERCAGFFAVGLAKASALPVAVTCTSGTAVAELLPAVVEAHEARVPLIVLSAVYLFFRHTRLGLGMRAAAFNPVSARLVGIRVGWMLALGWGLAAAIGAIAGMMVAPIVFLDPNMMAGILLYAFAGALLGGIDSPLGAVLGGFAVGVIENLMGAYVVGTELKLTVALIIIVCVLVVKPSGLLGRTVQSRV